MTMELSEAGLTDIVGGARVDQLPSTSSISNERTDSLSSPTNEIKNVGVEPDLFVLFYLLIYHSKYQSLSKREKTKWWLCVIFVLLTQIFCIIILSIAYLTHYSTSDSDTKYSVSKAWIIFEAPIHFCCVIASVAVLFSYLTNTILQSAKLYSATLNLADNNDPLLFKYGIIISTLNAMLSFSTWLISLVVINYSLYNQTENPADVVLASVGNVFILEIDDYFCGYFANTFLFDPNNYSQPWSIKVNKSQFQKSFFYTNQFIVFLHVIWLIVWSSVSGEFYNDFTEEPFGATRTLIIAEVSIMIYLVVGMMVTALTRGKKTCLTIVLLWASFMNIFQYIMIMFFSDNLNADATGLNGFAIHECWNKNGLPFCIISHLFMTIAIVLYILIVFCVIYKESILNQYFNKFWWGFHILSVIGLSIWRIENAAYNEGCYAIAFSYGSVYLKLYGKTVLGTI